MYSSRTELLNMWTRNNTFTIEIRQTTNLFLYEFDCQISDVLIVKLKWYSWENHTIWNFICSKFISLWRTSNFLSGEIILGLLLFYCKMIYPIQLTTERILTSEDTTTNESRLSSSSEVSGTVVKCDMFRYLWTCRLYVTVTV